MYYLFKTHNSQNHNLSKHNKNMSESEQAELRKLFNALKLVDVISKQSMYQTTLKSLMNNLKLQI